MKLVPFLCLFLLISTLSTSLIFADQEQPPTKKGEVQGDQKAPPKKHAKKKKKKLISDDDYDDDDEEDTCIIEFPIEIPEELFDSARQVSQQQLI